jgi:hypothetical protein
LGPFSFWAWAEIGTEPDVQRFAEPIATGTLRHNKQLAQRIFPLLLIT